MDNSHETSIKSLIRKTGGAENRTSGHRVSSVKIADWPPFGKELITRLSIRSDRKLSICNFSYSPFWFRRRDFVSACSWSLLTLYIFAGQAHIAPHSLLKQRQGLDRNNVLMHLEIREVSNNTMKN